MTKKYHCGHGTPVWWVKRKNSWSGNCFQRRLSFACRKISINWPQGRLWGEGNVVSFSLWKREWKWSDWGNSSGEPRHFLHRGSSRCVKPEQQLCHFSPLNSRAKSQRYPCTAASSPHKWALLRAAAPQFLPDRYGVMTAALCSVWEISESLGGPDYYQCLQAASALSSHSVWPLHPSDGENAWQSTVCFIHCPDRTGGGLLLTP